MRQEKFISILDKIDRGHENRTMPNFMLDLNLDQVVERIQFHWEDNIKELFYGFPVTEECEKYRRDVYSEIKRKSVRECLQNYVNQMRQWKRVKKNKMQVGEEIQKATWHLWEVYHYCIAFGNLYEDLCNETLYAEGFVGFFTYIKQYLMDENIVRMKNQAFAMIEKLQNLQVVLVMENNRIILLQEKAEDGYETFLKESFGEVKQKLRSPFATESNLSNLEQDLLTVLIKKNKKFFKDLTEFYENYKNYGDKVLLRFEKEIGYYLAFHKFKEIMEEKGFIFAIPTTDKGRKMEGVGVYDLALACINSRYDKGVVSNDVIYEAGEHFLVVTGPNQGGKTTFARSLGILVYFTKMGLEVPAVSANVPYYTDILTHFSVEESIETGRGKLQEELMRLSPMMQNYQKNAFVIINELFTTAANYDACIMGKRVLKHFMEQNCCGIYVTHLKELSEGDSRIASFKAVVEATEVEEDGVRKVKNVRKFKIIRSVAEDKGYAGDLVDKYRLTYAQLKQRMKGGR